MWRRMVRRAWRAMTAGMAISRNRIVRGSQARAGASARASSWEKASRSQARATIRHQIRFCVKPCKGKWSSPVSFAQRMRSPGSGLVAGGGLECVVFLGLGEFFFP